MDNPRGPCSITGMTTSAARIIARHIGLDIFRHDAETHALVGSMIYSEWDGRYGVTDREGRTARVADRETASRLMVLGVR